MLRRIGIGTISLYLLLQILCPHATMAAEVDEPNTEMAAHARSAILMDMGTGKILYQKQAHDRLPPASITKVMTLILVMESLEKGTIKLQDQVRVSEKAASMGGSQIFLESGEQMSVRDLLKAVAIGSANDASVALAEHIAGSERRFVHMMNRKVKELGLKNTRFRNVNGLPADHHYSSAYDIAVMSRELLRHESITRYTGQYEDYLRKGSKNPFWLVNTNRLLRFYEGLDGLKTGFTSESKYCLTATAKKGDLRLIAVVMGEPNPKLRNQEIAQLLDHAFTNYISYPIYQKGETIAQLPVGKGEPAKLEIQAQQPIHLLLKRGEDVKGIEKKIRWHQKQAPIRQGERLGQLQFKKRDKIIATYDLISQQSIQEADLWSMIKQVWEHTFQY